MTPSQQAVEDALNHFDDPEMVWHGFIGRHGRTLAAEVRRLRVTIKELRADAKEHDNEVRDAARGAAIEERWAAEERSRNYDY